MPRYAFRVEYLGTPFSGWQRQDGPPTVQGRVEAALRMLEPGCGSIAAAGRTDAGVHARGQVAHADLVRDWDPFRLSEALNHHLKPDPVAITAAARVADDFHARFSAIGRAYIFRIVTRRSRPVLEGGTVWHLKHDLDVSAMREAAKVLTGRHDFTTFRSSICQAASPVKTLDRIGIEVADYPGGREIRLAFDARSFLHNQVRSLVGTLERVGAGAWTVADVADALAARDRAACGPVAPPGGLCLERVDYPRDPFGAA